MERAEIIYRAVAPPSTQNLCAGEKCVDCPKGHVPGGVFPYVRHAWAGAWVNSLFRNESDALSSDLIREAVAATRWRWDAPPLGMVTFVDAGKVRRKRDPGRCYRKAGFKPCGHTKGGLVALQLLPEDMPPPMSPMDSQLELRLEESRG